MAQNNQQLEKIRAGYVSIKDILTKNRDAISAALPKHINADTMLQVTLTTIRVNPKLAECEPKSMLTAILIASQFGLLPDGVTGQSYIIPYWNSKKGVLEAQLQIGYKGELELARRSGQVARVECNVVYEKDSFEYEFGLAPVLKFKPSTGGDRGKKLYIYALVMLKDGSPYFDVWTIGQIDDHRRRFSKQPDGPAWTSSPDKMGKKTVLKQVLDYCPMSVEYQKANRFDDLAEGGQPQMLDIELSPDDFTVSEAEEQPRGKLDQIVEQDQAKRQSDAEVRPALDAEEQRVKNADKGKPTGSINDGVTQSLGFTESDPGFSADRSMLIDAVAAVIENGSLTAAEIKKVLKDFGGETTEKVFDSECANAAKAIRAKVKAKGAQ